MAQSQTSFPLNGVIGIVDSSTAQLELANELGLHSVEIRADLLRSGAGLSDSELLSVVGATKALGLACLFTFRHADQGGTFNGQESARIALCTQALEAGADIIDLEYGTDAAIAMLSQCAPMILSHHNFDRMLTTDELAALSDAMEAQAPAAVKIIPTGQSLTDAATMMGWVAGAGSRIKRIGFSMGADGANSRILAMTRGAPITYASFGEPVAPGQVDIKLMLERYKCMSMTVDTQVTALIGDVASIDRHQSERKVAEQSKSIVSHVYVGFSVADAPAIERLQKDMNINDIIYL